MSVVKNIKRPEHRENYVNNKQRSEHRQDAYYDQQEVRNGNRYHEGVKISDNVQYSSVVRSGRYVPIVT